MAQGSPGADSCTPVTAGMIQEAQTLFGAMPVFWGRYFTSIATTGTVEYRGADENQPLNCAGIRVLPVGRQTSRVNGSTEQGLADGSANAKDFIETFTPQALIAQGGVFYMFLDVEGSPSLSQDYFTGWAQGLAQVAQSLSGGAVQILPCIYGAWSDIRTWSAVAAAMESGVPCKGAWISRYYSGLATMGDWLDHLVTPQAPAPFPCPILAWQYAGDCLNGQIDCSQTNPAIDYETALLPYLVLPPIRDLK